MSLTKQELRAQALAHRETIDLTEEDPEQAAALFFDNIPYGTDTVVAGFWPKENEFDVRHILRRLCREGVPCCLPVVGVEATAAAAAAAAAAAVDDDDDSADPGAGQVASHSDLPPALRFVAWSEGAPLKEGPFGLCQPPVDEKTDFLEPDIVLVPFLAFDRKGNRIGYGGGYYDATLAALRAQKDILAVGVGFGLQASLFPLPAEPHDQPLDWVITPQQVFCFKELQKRA